ncbi:MAG: hypothetical protein ACRD2L_18915, partial [Terriglobia bacterium]
GKGLGQFDLEGFARRKAEKEVGGTPQEKVTPTPPAKGWTTDPGAIPGEPQFFFGKDIDSAKAAIIERENQPVDGQSQFEAMLVRSDPEGILEGPQSVGIFATAKEAAAAAEAALKPQKKPLKESFIDFGPVSPKDMAMLKERLSAKPGDKTPAILSEMLRRSESFKDTEVFMQGDIGVEVAKGPKGYSVSVIREGENTHLETFPTQNLALALKDELLAKGATKARMSVVEAKPIPVQGKGKAGIANHPAIRSIEKEADGWVADLKEGWYDKESDTTALHEQSLSRIKERLNSFVVRGMPRDVRPKVPVVPGEYPALPLEKTQAAKTTAEEGISNSMEELNKAVEKPAAEDKPAPGMDDPTIFLNMGVPFRMSDVKAAFNMARKVPGASVAEGKLRAYWDATLRAFAPESLGPVAKQAGAIVASRVASSAIRENMAHGPPSATRTKFWNQRQDEVAGFRTAYEKGERFADPLMQRAADAYRAWSKRLADTEQKLGWTYETVENYLYHVFEDGPGVQRFFEERHGLKWGDPGFIKARTFALYDEAIAAGFKPKFSNPEDIMLARQHAHEVARGKVETLRELAEYGLAVKVKRKEKLPPEGFAAAPRRAPTGEHYWVHREADVFLKKLYDTKSLWTMGGAGANLFEKAAGSTFRGFMFLKNSTVPIILSASGFHGLHVLTIDNVPSAIRAVKEWAGHSRSATSAVGQVAGAFVYRDILKNPRGGSRINNIIRGRIPEAEWTQGDIQALTTMAEGGFVPLQSHVYVTNAWENFRNALQKHQARAGFHAPFAAIQLLQKPMFEYWIPALKANSYLQDAAAALKADPTLLQDAGRRKETLRRISKSVDNRYGEMAYNTLFWDRWVKDVGVATTLSLGWNLGFLREYGGAPIDVAVSGGKGRSVREGIAKGDYDKAMFITMYTAQALAYGGLITYLFTGDLPQDLLDYTHPRIGEQNADGSEKRVNTMFYPREFVSIAKHIEQEGAVSGVGHLLASKAAPSLALVKAWATGMDSLGREIRDPDGSPYRKLQQTLAHTLWELEPISIETLRQGGGDAKSAALALAGFSPAPKYITATKTEATIRRVFQEYHGAKKTPYERAEYSEEASRLKRLFAEGDTQKYITLLSEVERKYELSPGELRRLTNSVEKGEDPLPKMFARLDWRKQQKILDQMTPEERDVYLPHANKDHLRHDYLPPELRQ